MKPLIRDRLSKALLTEIATGARREGDQFLSRRRIQADWGVSRITALEALDTLVGWGVLLRRDRSVFRVATHAVAVSKQRLRRLRRLRVPPLSPVPQPEREKDEGMQARLLKSLLVEVASGALPAGTRFLSRRKIASLWNVPRPMIEKVRGNLVAAGLLEKMNERTFVITSQAIEKASLALNHNSLPELPLPETWRNRRNQIVHVARSAGYRLGVIHDEGYTRLKELHGVPLRRAKLPRPIQDHYTSEILKEAVRHGCETTFFRDPGSHEAGQHTLELITRRKLDGVAICQHNRFHSRRPLLRELKRLGIPVITIMGDCEGEADALVACNEVGGGFDAMKILVDKGHRDILIVENARSHTSSFRRRYDGAKRCLAEFGKRHEVRVRLRRVTAVPHSRQVLWRVLRNRKQWPTAILFLSIFVFPKTDLVLQRAGVEIPRDISVIGCGSPDLGSTLYGSPDVLAKCMGELGKTGIRQLMSLLHGQPVPRATLVDMSYFPRGTVGRPRATLHT